MDGFRIVSLWVGSEGLCQGCAYVPTAFHHSLDGVGDFGGVACFGDVAGCTGFQGTQSVLLFGMRRHHQDRCFGTCSFDFLEEFQAAVAVDCQLEND